MAQDRTQPPSKRRRQMARQHGQAAHSPELTAAAGWLTAVAVLGFLGDDLALGLTRLVHASLTTLSGMTADRSAVVAQVRGLIVGLGWPLAAIMAAFAAGALAAHQLQVRGLWAPALIVPTPNRLWALSSQPGLSARAERAVWSVLKAAILVTMAVWSVRAGWLEVLSLGGLEGPALAREAGHALLRLGWLLAAVLLVLGLADYGLRYWRFELMLRTTTQEQREDRRIIEGDPALRAQRRRVARSMRGDSPELFSGASLILNGPSGLTLVLEGGPPPRRVTVRTAVKGHAGISLRRSAGARNVPNINAPDLARRLARRPSPRSPVAAELIAELAAIWPVA